MLKQSVVLKMLVVSMLAAPLLARAQFHDPTKEELQMTEDPKAPGAAAVFLEYSETDDDPLHYQTLYARIKVLQEKGKELATIQMPFEKGFSKITDIRGRTIHADGTVIPLKVKPEDLMISREGEKQYEKRVFTLPSVEVGSILEYTLSFRYDDNYFVPPDWVVQGDYFYHKVHYSYRPFENFQPGLSRTFTSSISLLDENGDMVNSLIWWPILPKGAAIKTDAGGHFTLDLTDVPALPDEDWMPPLNAYRYKVNFYYKSGRSAQEFWPNAAKRWTKEVDRFAEPSKAIREAVNGVIAPGDTEMVKAQKIYKAVQALENTDYTRSKGEAEKKQLRLKTAKHAEDVWAQKSGDSDELAMLYLAMAKAAGLNVVAAQVADRAERIFDVSYLHSRQADDTVIMLTVDGKAYPVDPGEKMCTFGQLSWRHAAAGGFRQISSGEALIATPYSSYSENKTTRIADVTLSADGAANGNIRIIMTGQSALHWRQLALREDPEELKKDFDHSLEALTPQGVEAHLDHFIGLEDPAANLLAVIEMKGQMGAATARRLILPAFFFESRGKTPFVKQENRQTSVDMHYAEQIVEQVTYHLPAGLTVEGIPQNNKEVWKDHAVLNIATKTGNGDVIIARTLARGFTFAKPEEYQDLRAFYQKVGASDQQQLVLTNALAAVKGN
jgi:hypothetical protein